MSKLIKIELEFLIHSSSKVIYNFISSPNGLAEWFANDVKVNPDGTLTFIWDKSEQTARIIAQGKKEFVRFQWVDTEDEDSYFEIAIKENTYESGVALIITDFCEKGEEKDIASLWENQISKLARKVGG